MADKDKDVANKNIEHATTTDAVVEGPKKLDAPVDGTTFKPADKIDLIATGKSKHMPKDAKYPGVQKIHADRLIAKGSAKKA